MKRRKVFGIGLSKTGTTSLNAALRILGYNTRHFPFTFLTHKNDILKLDMNKVAKTDGITDTPAARFFKEIDKQFPGSKFVLTLRDKKSWLNSCQRHIWLGKYYKKPWRINHLQKDLYGTIVYDEKKFSDAYDRHLKEVNDYFKNRKQDILILNVCKGEGWKELCSFLQKPMPRMNFPRSNIGFHRIVNEIFRKLSLPQPFRKKVIEKKPNKQRN